MSEHRPLVVGAGIAGLWAAWRLAESGRHVLLVTKDALDQSASSWAQGGVAVALAPGDSPAMHAADTIAAGDGLSDPEAVRILTTEGPDRIRELLELGADFDRAPDGTLRFGLEAAHSRPRILHALGDATGAALIRCLLAVVADHPRIEVRPYTTVRRLVTASRRVVGAVLLDPNGHAYGVAAPAVMLATGGAGQLYAVTTNPPVATADGWALAHQVGARLRDLEFLQFHPTALKLPGVNPAPLISEAVRGEGAILVDVAGRRFALDADPRGELAPRDIVARAVAAADAAGGAWLDARAVPGLAFRFPGITRMLATHGLSLERDLIPIAPALHYAMGGIATDLEGRSSRAGLWAIGECASTGVHGANRLASNSLLEGLVFADRAGRAVGAEGPMLLPAVAAADGDDDDGAADAAAAPLLEEMRQLMTGSVGLQRTEVTLARAELELAGFFVATPPRAWRTANQLIVARLITESARRRRESRGGHRRVDYPPREARASQQAAPPPS